MTFPIKGGSELLYEDRMMRIENVEELAEMLKVNPDLAKAQVVRINHNLEETIKILGGNL